MEQNTDIFNQFLAEAQGEVGETTNTEVEETTEDIVEEQIEEVEETTEIESNEEETEDTSIETVETEEEQIPEFKAFAEMRVKNKQLAEEKEKVESEVQKVEALAMKLGYATVDEMLAEANKRELESEAKTKNMPVEYLKDLKETKSELERIKQERALEKQMEIESKVVGAIESFMESNKLNEKDQMKTLASLEADGFTWESLVQLPASAVTKLLSSYVDKKTVKQKELEEKVRIQKEIPLTPVDKKDAPSKTIEDEYFEYFTGEKRDF